MQKIYVRPISLSYGSNAKKLIQQKQALPICSNKNIAFSQIEIFFLRFQLIAPINTKIIIE